MIILLVILIIRLMVLDILNIDGIGISFNETMTSSWTDWLSCSMNIISDGHEDIISLNILFSFL